MRKSFEDWDINLSWVGAGPITSKLACCCSVLQLISTIDNYAPDFYNHAKGRNGS